MSDMSRSREQIRYWLSQLDGYAPPDFDDLSTEEIERLQLYRIIANQIPQRVFLKDLNSSYVWTNRRFADDANVDSPAELVGKTDLDMPWTNEQSESYTADDQMVIQTGQPKINIIELQTRSDGSHAWLHTNKVPVFGKDGEVIGVIGTYEDITERAQAEIALRRYQQMVESIFNHIPVAIFWKDLDLRYSGCNSNFATDAGLDSPDDVVGKTDKELPWKVEHADLFQADDLSVIESGEPKLNYIEKQLQANGKVAWLQTNKVPLFDANNKVIGVLGTYQNITEQIEARESLRRARLAALEDRQRLARELHDAVSQTLWTASLMADMLPDVWDNDREEGEESLEKLKRLTKGALSEMRMLLLELRPSALVETDLSELLDRLAEAIMSRAGLSSGKPSDLFKVRPRDKGKPQYEAQHHAYEVLVECHKREGLYWMPCASPNLASA